MNNILGNKSIEMLLIKATSALHMWLNFNLIHYKIQIMIEYLCTVGTPPQILQ